VASPKTVNDVIPFLHFLEKHPIGSTVKGTVESYSSHGAYVQIGDVRGYVPLRLMGDPPPRAARDVMALGDQVSLEVMSVVASRRSIDLKPSNRKGDVKIDDAKSTAKKSATAKKAATPKSAAKKAAAAKDGAAKKVATKKVAVKKVAVKKVATKKTATKKAATPKTVAKKATTKKTAAPKKSARATVTKK